MIPTIPERRQVPAWQQEMARALSDPAELLAYLELPPHTPRADSAGAGAQRPPGDFALRVPRGFAARMRKGDPRDPLFLQVWQRPQETDEVPGFGDDAVGDLARLKSGGIIHKYAGRALVVATGACAVHCRYCFRRHFPYGEAMASRGGFGDTLRALADDRSIEEVILSGGDPLSLPDEKLARFAEGLEFLPHVRRLRLHTRTPIVLPERVDDALLAWLARGRLQKIVVVHANHANELEGAVPAALRRLAQAGATLLNQSVLLAGVNDTTDALVTLSTRLFECGVLPYYLHMLDRVRGTAHFEVPEVRARTLVRAAAARLPGYLVPKLVREEAGAPSKTALSW